MRKDVAIVGISGRFPDAPTIGALLENLTQGTHSSRGITPERIRKTALPPDAEYKTCGYIEDIDLFDHGFFNISLGEAETMDPHQRLLLEVVQETFDNAGYAPAALQHNNISIYVAAKSLNYYMHAEKEDPTLVTGNGAVFIPARIAKHFGLKGNSALIDTSCSSSLVCVHLACNDLHLGDAEMAIACGVNIELFPFKNEEGGNLDLESPDGISRSFSAAANGMSYGEIVACVLLKPLEKALADGDVIHAVIKGSAVNNNANSGASLTAPDSLAQAEVIISAMERAGITPDDIDFIEAHGSATQLGDSIEVAALDRVFRKRSATRGKLPISTIKSNIGHCRGAAGIAGLIKAMLTLKHDVLFRSLHFDSPNPYIDIVNSPVVVNTATLNGGNFKPRFGGVTSIGLSGVNCHVVLEKAPERQHDDKEQQKPEVIVLSSRTRKGLIEAIAKLRQSLEIGAEQGDLKRISYTLATGRTHHPFRWAFVAKDILHLRSELDEVLAAPSAFASRPVATDVIFVFSPALHVPSHCLDQLLSTYDFFKREYATLLALIPDGSVNENTLALCFQYSFYRLLASLDLTPQKIIGLGVGRIAADLILQEITPEAAIRKTIAIQEEVFQDLDRKLKNFIVGETEVSNVAVLEIGFEGLLSQKFRTLESEISGFATVSLDAACSDVLLGILRDLYTVNHETPWASVFKGRSIRKAELPAGVFDKTRCWIREEPRIFSIHPETLDTRKVVFADADKSSSIERTVAEMMHSILGVHNLTLDSDFFELGGDSLKATQLVRKIEEQYQFAIDFEDIFDFPSIRGLAGFLAPRWNMELQIASFWKEVLKTPAILPEDNFFSLGGHSLNASKVINRIREAHGIHLDFEHFFKYPTVRSLAAHINALKATPKTGDDVPAIAKIQERECYAVSPAQKRLWVACQFREASLAYNQTGSYYFSGKFYSDAFEKALQLLIERHESLRTVFIQVNDEPMQAVLPANAHGFVPSRIDLSGWTDAETEVVRLIHEMNRIPFDFKKGPLIRVRIVKLSDDQHVFLYTIHHLIYDGWSANVFLNDLAMLYESCIGHSPGSLKPLPVQYRDYAEWQNQMISHHSGQHKKFWATTLQAPLPILNIQADFIRPQYRTWNGDVVNTVIDRETSAGLYALCRQKEVSLFILLMASLKVLLYKYSGQEDIIVGSPVSGRSRKELEDQIGLFVNTLPFRSRISPADSFLQFLAQVKEFTLQAYQYQDYPFDLMLDDSEVRRDLSRSPLVDVVMVLHNMNGKEAEDRSPGDRESVQTVGTKHHTSLVDLRIQFLELNDGIKFSIEYNIALFHRTRMERMLSHFNQVLSSILSDPTVSIKDLQYIPDEEYDSIRNKFSRGRKRSYSTSTLSELFSQQSRKSPDAYACVNGRNYLTYRELNEKANALARELQQQYHIKPGDVAALLADNSYRAIIGLLAVLKIGAIYVSIDPKHPKDRKEFIVNDTGAKIILTDSEYIFDLQEFPCKIFALDIQLQGLSHTVEEIVSKLSTDSIAYINYTSGSTGRPKGVPIKQESIVDRSLYCADYLGIVSRDKMLQFASLSFDASLYEIFMSLFTGACLVIPEPHEKSNISAMIELFDRHQVTVATLPPAYIKLLDRHPLPSVKTIVSTGEAAIMEDALFYASIKNYYNGYGPTETCIGASFYKVNPDEAAYYRSIGAIPIGQPFANTTLYVLDDELRPVSMGSPGNIYVSGKGLSPGYLNNPELTADKFLRNVFESADGPLTMYKTGDLGRWNHNGELEFLGRSDNQVQINGIRVELDEIRSVLLQQPEVSQAMVVLREDNALVAYVSLNVNDAQAYSNDEFSFTALKPSVTETDISRRLMNQLPPHMVPHRVRFVESFALNSNGKIDVPALALYDDSLPSAVEFIAPTNDVEKSLQEIWEKVLGKEGIGMHDNLFDLGANSIKAIKALTLMDNLYPGIFDITVIFSEPTIADLANRTTQGSKATEELRELEF